ncbi:MAG: dihydrolipoyl dehydrogenase [Dehalococcoidia bacterium]|nr:dihydrolipoyl dehydrogenase [Dehalococcoidia bacterium]
MTTNGEYDLVVVGAGPGGYVAGIRAAELGLSAAVVERDELGGVCLNWGCIPSKSLLKNAEILSLIHRGEEFGFYFDNLRVDYAKAIDRSRGVVDRNTKGIAFLFRKNKVEHIKGEASLRDSHTLEIAPEGRVIQAKNIILATGARARSIPALPIDGERVITSRHALELKQLPSSIIIVGAGATGMEFAYVYNSYGVKVTVVELLPRVVPNEDEEISQELERALSREGITFMTGAGVTEMTPMEGGARLKVESSNQVTEIEGEKVLVAIGVQANTEGLGLDRVGGATERGFIQVNDDMSTNVPGTYAIGDVTGKLLLAHVASAQGVMAVETIAGVESQPLDYVNMPRAIYCIPQVASFGLTEQQAREQGYGVRIGKFPFQASGKAVAIGETEGTVKLVVDEKYGELLGAHLIGPEVTELLAELSMARLLEGTTHELGWMVHSHPTLSEVLKEAALNADGGAIHI